MLKGIVCEALSSSARRDEEFFSVLVAFEASFLASVFLTGLAGGATCFTGLAGTAVLEEGALGAGAFAACLTGCLTLEVLDVAATFWPFDGAFFTVTGAALGLTATFEATGFFAAGFLG
jgi:hypothetical protein